MLLYVRELEEQGGVAVQEMRVLLLGAGEQGKSCLVKALQHPSGLTTPIATHDRTVGVDVTAGWRPGGARGAIFHL